MLLSEPDLKKHSLVHLRLWYSSTTELEKKKKTEKRKKKKCILRASRWFWQHGYNYFHALSPHSKQQCATHLNTANVILFCTRRTDCCQDFFFFPFRKLKLRDSQPISRTNLQYHITFAYQYIWPKTSFFASFISSLMFFALAAYGKMGSAHSIRPQTANKIILMWQILHSRSFFGTISTFNFRCFVFGIAFQGGGASPIWSGNLFIKTFRLYLLHTSKAITLSFAQASETDTCF